MKMTFEQFYEALFIPVADKHVFPLLLNNVMTDPLVGRKCLKCDLIDPVEDRCRGQQVRR
jgi:hypothetical protein